MLPRAPAWRWPTHFWSISYEDWDGFYEFHKLGYDELEHFDYEAYKANGFEIPNPGCAPLGPEPLGHAY